MNLMNHLSCSGIISIVVNISECHYGKDSYGEDYLMEQVSDVVAVACRAAADAGIRSVCVTNFSWDFIYAEYVMAAGYHHRSIVWQVLRHTIFCN